MSIITIIKGAIDVVLRFFSIAITFPGFLILLLFIFREQIKNLFKLSERLIKLKIGDYIIEFSDAATSHIETTKIEDGEFEVKFNTSIEFTESSKGHRNFLSLRARIYYDSVAGAQYLMKIYVNDKLITNEALINKQADYQYIHGRIYKWYDEKLKSWSVVYSPDFILNYSHDIYKIINGDPYIFIFDISKIKDKNGEYEIKVVHNGRKGQIQYENSLIVRDIQVFS